MPAPFEDKEIEEALDRLVEDGPLGVAFQPIVDLWVGEPVGYEVLGRCAPIEGALASLAGSPAALIEIAHRYGRLLGLERRWRELAVSAIARGGDKRHLFFLNVDPRAIEYPNFAPGYTLALMEQFGLSPDRCVLELTEAASQDPDRVDAALEHYARQGFRVALDDLGAGQQSLLTLLRLQPQIVKLDRGLIHNIDSDESRRHLLHALAEFARRSGITLVAEGIETQAQLRVVAEARIACGQGFLLGRPAPRPEPLAAEAQHTLRVEVRMSSDRVTPRREPQNPSASLLHMVEGIKTAPSLEAMLQRVTDGTAGLLSVSRVTLWLLDERRIRSLLTARTGASLHRGVVNDLIAGEGPADWVAAHGMLLRVDDVANDPRFAANATKAGLHGSFLGVPLVDAEGTIAVLAATALDPQAFSAADERWLRLVAGVAAPSVDAARQARLALTDPQTLAWSRLGLEMAMPSFDNATLPTSVVAFNLDDFRALDDRIGRDSAGEVLGGAVRLVANVLRRDDRIVRLAVDTFLVVLPGIDRGEVRAIAERFRETVAAAVLHPGLPGLRVTLSAGIATRTGGESRDRLIHRAHAALRCAKSLGKNRVVSDEAPPADPITASSSPPPPDSGDAEP